jgi:hypothetical protein
MRSADATRVWFHVFDITTSQEEGGGILPPGSLFDFEYDFKLYRRS